MQGIGSVSVSVSIGHNPQAAHNRMVLDGMQSIYAVNIYFYWKR